MTTLPTTRPLAFDDISVGDELPPFDVALTVQRMIMETAANHDAAPIHHDRDIARALGAPDMFVNTLFVQAVYEATVREWAGLAMRLVSMRFKMHAFNCAGEMLISRGRVAEKSNSDDGSRVTVEITTETSLGITTRGQVVIEFSP
jgi:acyl dehydratase